jgi:CIC family chloride channel protein
MAAKGLLSFFRQLSKPAPSSRWLIYFVLIGVIAGAGAIFFQVLCELGMRYLLDQLAGYRPDTPGGEVPLFPHSTTVFNRWILLFLPALGGLVSGWIVYTYAPEAEGHGTDAAIDAYHNKGGVIRPMVPLVKTVASAITLTSGGSGGREGPIAQIGAGFGSFLGARLGFSARERRIMLAAGMAAGVGSIFRAPLAGALFAAEVLYRDPEFEAEVLIPAGISSVVAYCLFCLVFGWGSLFHSPDFTFNNPLELGPYITLALVLSGISFGYVGSFYGVRELFRAIPMPLHLKPALGGLLTGIIGFFLPQTLAFGYGILQKALFGELGMLLLLFIAFGKILTTSFTISSGGSGGVFGPSVVIGGCLGGALGQAFQAFAPSIAADPAAMAVVGMAGFFTAVSNAPISTIIFVSEMTNSYQLLLPSLLVCLLCYQFARRWSIYEEQERNKMSSRAHAGDFFVDILQAYRVADLREQIQSVFTVPETMTFAEFKDFYTQTNQEYFPVVDENGELTSIFSISDFRAILFSPDVENLVVMKDIGTGDLITTTLSEDLDTVMGKFTKKNLESLPVVREDNPRKLEGMLRRKEVIAFYNQRVSEIGRMTR